MVHTEEEIGKPDSSELSSFPSVDMLEVKKPRFLMESPAGYGDWYINLRFEDIPKVFIERITERFWPTTSVENWERSIAYFNIIPTIWNSCLVRDDRIVAFSYGDWDPLLSHMQVIRLSIEPKLFRVDGRFFRDATLAIRKHAKLLGVERIFWLTCRWKAFLRKAPELFQLAEAKVLEVKNV